MPDINMQVFEEARRNQLVTEIDIQTQVALDDYQVQLSDIANPTQSQDNVVIDRFGEFLPHWNESLDFDTWVKMNMEVAGKRILMIRGNSNVSSISSIDDTFIFGDDFDDDLLDDTKWTPSGTIEVASSEITLNADDSIISINTFGFNTIITSKSKADEQDISFIGYYIDTDNRNEIINADITANDDFDNIMLYVCEAASSTTIENQWSDFRNTYYQYTIERINSSSLVYKQGANSASFTNSAYIIDPVAHIKMNTWDSSQASTLVCDWVYVRKYTATKPTWTADSEEQNIAVALKSLGRAG